MKRILIIDDDRIIQDILAEALRHFGYEVVSLRNSTECVEKTVEFKPDLILLDVMMPELNGFGVLEKFKTLGIIPATPVIVLTALSGETGVEQVLSYGAKDCWFKTDYDTSQLAEKIKKVLETKN